MRYRFNYTGDLRTCRWCGKPLRKEHVYRQATDNEAGELLAWLGDDSNSSGRRKHPELGWIYVEGGWGSRPPTFRVRSGKVTVGVCGEQRLESDGPPGTVAKDSRFCTWVCGTLFADRMVDLGHGLELNE